MIGALIILLITITVGAVLYVYDLKWRREHSEQETTNEASDAPEADSHGDICCGRHILCEMQFPPAPGEKPVYYDDEELDRFAGRNEDDYSEEEIEEIRDVMITLLPEDVNGWVRSIQLRGINLPSALRDEIMILLAP